MQKEAELIRAKADYMFLTGLKNAASRDFYQGMLEGLDYGHFYLTGKFCPAIGEMATKLLFLGHDAVDLTDIQDDPAALEAFYKTLKSTAPAAQPPL